VKTSNQRLKNVLTVRSKILQYARGWLNKEGFVEVQGPMLFPAYGERPNHFSVKYFDKAAYLSGGLAPYSDEFLSMFNRIFTVAPTFRVEQNTSKRHLAEYWRIEVCGLCEFEELLAIEEKLLAHILQSLTSNHEKELIELKSPITNLKKLETPFPRLTYDKVIKQLQKNGINIQWGEPISKTNEVALTKQYEQPFFITHFPLNPETALYRTIPNEGLLTFSADLLAPQGYGEIGACNELITHKALIRKRLTELGVETEEQEWYLRIRKKEVDPQTVMTLGLERLLQWICNIGDIKETTLAPRQYRKRLR
jgi:asparaginyl-tRNA synthetase